MKYVQYVSSLFLTQKRILLDEPIYFLRVEDQLISSEPWSVPQNQVVNIDETVGSEKPNIFC